MASRKLKNGRFSSVLVPVEGNASDQAAVELACNLASGWKGTVYVLHVIEVERSLPLDAEIPAAATRAEEVLTAMEDVAKPHRCKVQAEMLQSRRAGPAIVQASADRQVDAIVVGADYATSYGSFSLGATVPYLLENAPCKVILWRNGVSPSGAAG